MVCSGETGARPVSLFLQVPEAAGKRPPVPQLGAQRGKSPRKHWVMDVMGVPCLVVQQEKEEQGHNPRQ